MASSSPEIQEHLEYLYASNANVSNFVSVKLSGKHNYHRWKTQMLCLMETHSIHGLVNDASVDDPRALSERIRKQYDSLLKGWIFGSISEGVFDTVVDLSSAKEVWDKLKSLYEHVQPTTSSQQGIALLNHPKEDIEDGKGTSSKEAKTMSEEEKDRKSELLKATWDLNWRKIKEILEKDKNLLTEALLDTGDTILHIAVEMGQPDFVEKLLLFIQEKKIRIDQQNEDGSTVLHVAVSAGNKHAMKLLVDKHKELLTIQDANNQNPLIKAFNDMQYDIFIYLLKKSEELDFSQDKETGARLLVNAITAKQYSTALELIDMFPKFAVENDEVLVAIARNFPSELNYWETLICPLIKS